MGKILDPIVILAMPRSGSSMTAGIFSKHGVWTGRTHPGSTPNPKGYFENLDFKEDLIRRYGRLAQTTSPATHCDGFAQFVRRTAPEGKKWLVKHSAMYRKAWDEFSPKFVCVRRRIDGLLGSNRKSGFLGTRDDVEMRKIIEAHNEQMDIAVSLQGGMNVYPDEWIEGNYESIEKALEFCGIEPNRSVIEDFVEPEYWERWSR